MNNDTPDRVLIRTGARHTWARPLSDDEIEAIEQERAAALDHLAELLLQLAQLKAELNPKIRAAKQEIDALNNDLDHRERTERCTVRTEYCPNTEKVHVIRLATDGMPETEIEVRDLTPTERVRLALSGLPSTPD